MRARILFVSDLHKRDCDVSTIAGYAKAADTVQRDVLAFMWDESITHFGENGNRRLPATTKAGSRMRHTEVKLPVVEVEDNGHVNCAHHVFSLPANLLKFYQKKETPIQTTVPAHDQMTGKVREQLPILPRRSV